MVKKIRSGIRTGEESFYGKKKKKIGYTDREKYVSNYYYQKETNDVRRETWVINKTEKVMLGQICSTIILHSIFQVRKSLFKI